MWCLIQNLICGPDYRPFLDSASSAKRKLRAGQPYTERDLDEHMFSSDHPYEITQRYSDELKNLVKECLIWDPQERITMEELKVRVDQAKADRAVEAERDRNNDLQDLVRLAYPEGAGNFEMGKVHSGRKRKTEANAEARGL